MSTHLEATTATRPVRPPRSRHRRSGRLALAAAVILSALVAVPAAATPAPADPTAATRADSAGRWAPTRVTSARRSTANTTFSIAVMPDTQMEVHEATDPRFLQRAQWLADHQRSLDLRFVTHTGDVVDWDTPDHAQTKMASAGMLPLERAKIPYSLSIGNHDTQATTVGGGARDPHRTRALQRDTSVFNSYFTAARYGAVKGAFEPGKVDNIYSTFSAGGLSWLVLNLELWPRAAVVDWAKQVVASHPRDNVIIATHYYLDADTSIATGHGYGDTSPQYLFDNLVKVYPNVKLVFSGHVGLAGRRTDVGVHGNKIVSYLATMHSRTTNPVRLVEINTATDSLSTRLYAPKDGATYPEYADQQSGMGWVVRPES